MCVCVYIEEQNEKNTYLPTYLLFIYSLTRVYNYILQPSSD